MNETAYLFKSSELGRKAHTAKAEIGKWFKFDHGNENTGYGKVVAINGNGTVEVEKYFSLPKYRPYATHKWFDDLPMAVMSEEEENLLNNQD